MNQVSFKDPEGFVISSKTGFYRVVFHSFKEELSQLQANPDILAYFSSHQELEKDNYPDSIIDHLTQQEREDLLVIFKLQDLPMITYPWEWTPEMLRLAGIYTLDVLRAISPLGLTLKDASFFNIQFINGQPKFIDLLSVKKVDENNYPWPAYGQFLRHFINPLVLIKYNRFPSLSFLSSFLDGISSKIVRTQTPFTSFLNIYELLNIHLLNYLSSKEQPQIAESKWSSRKRPGQLIQLIDYNLSYLNALKQTLKPQSESNWSKYYQIDVVNDYTERKEQAILDIIQNADECKSIIDVGANTGDYSEIVLPYTDKLISIEQDPECCKIIWEKISAMDLAKKEWIILQNDLLMPSARLGWCNAERLALSDRLQASMVLVLALIHHLYFTGSIDFREIFNFFSTISNKYIVIEYIAVEDEKIKRIASNNTSRLKNYNLQNFENALAEKFDIIRTYKLSPSRELYYCVKRQYS